MKSIVFILRDNEYNQIRMDFSFSLAPYISSPSILCHRAEQVILVRNELQKVEIRKRIDALVLTITEVRSRTVIVKTITLRQYIFSSTSYVLCLVTYCSLAETVKF